MAVVYILFEPFVLIELQVRQVQKKKKIPFSNTNHYFSFTTLVFQLPVELAATHSSCSCTEVW